MRYPYYKCMECDEEIAEMSFPIPRNQKYPNCPVCHNNDNVDIVLGNENTELDSEMIIYTERK